MAQSLFDFQPQRKIYSVVEISRELRSLIEQRFPDIWVLGEISNFRTAGSGHCYFTLKDASAQLRAVCFKTQARYLKFKPRDGLSVIARGRLGIYESRSEYQLSVEYLEPAGLGALQLAFEQLKSKLAAEGLFDPGRKKPIPALPRCVGVVTSPTGAVIQDILRILRRRFEKMNVAVYPVRVQGEGAEYEIVEAIQYFNRQPIADVIILARGGGSLEDLWAFNEEVVARAIAASTIPVISAVGHETDFTIADFVADLRAPTPSAAAEIVVNRWEELVNLVQGQIDRMAQLMRIRISDVRQRLTELRMHHVFPAWRSRLAARGQHLDELTAALDRSIRERLNRSRQAWMKAAPGVVRYDLKRLVGMKIAETDEYARRMQAAAGHYLAERRNYLRRVQSVLNERSPLVILGRGYSITRDADGKILRDASEVAAGSDISIRLARGELSATVK